MNFFNFVSQEKELFLGFKSSYLSALHGSRNFCGRIVYLFYLCDTEVTALHTPSDVATNFNRL